jgi:photosystem II stability/assembly factor-like uncharacterized protein
VIKEVLAMRKLVVLLPLILAGCSNGGTDVGTPFQPIELAQHVPQIAGLELSPGTAIYMDGGGSVPVEAQFSFTDSGLDIATIHIEMSDGVTLTMAFPDAISTETGTHTEVFDMPSTTVGSYTLDVWLVDKLGAASNHATAIFEVMAAAEVTDWTNQLTGLSFVLNDIVWDGIYFIAVGNSGAVLTSADGVAWTEQETGADFDIIAVASDGTDVVAVGKDMQVLLSSDHGQGWSIKSVGHPGNLRAVAINASQIVAGGIAEATSDAFIVRSVDRGESWMVVESLPMTGHWVIELAHANGLFVAGTDFSDWDSGARVLVSFDGEFWQELVLSDEAAMIFAIVHDGDRFIATGSERAVFASVDGFDWRELQTPPQDIHIQYRGAACAGSTIMIHGGTPWWYWWIPDSPPPHQDAGISSTDGGATWEGFDIDGYYQTRGMAYGNGRFVSVGQTTPISGEGAIYTSP